MQTVHHPDKPGFAYVGFVYLGFAYLGFAYLSTLFDLDMSCCGFQGLAYIVETLATSC